MTKFIVICVSSETGVCSVDPFDTEPEAQKFLKRDSEDTYDDNVRVQGIDHATLELKQNYAQVTDDDYSLIWTIHKLTF